MKKFIKAMQRRWYEAMIRRCHRKAMNAETGLLTEYWAEKALGYDVKILLL